MTLPKPLPSGITGFNFEGTVQKWKVIKKQIIGGFLAEGLKVGQIEPCDNEVARNYHVVFLGPGAALIHRFFPYIAFASVQSLPYLEIPFADDILLERAVSKWLPDWQYIPSSELLQPVTMQALAQLGEGEQEQIRHWKPTTVGDLIFNNWD